MSLSHYVFIFIFAYSFNSKYENDPDFKLVFVLSNNSQLWFTVNFQQKNLLLSQYLYKCRNDDECSFMSAEEKYGRFNDTIYSYFDVFIEQYKIYKNNHESF